MNSNRVDVDAAIYTPNREWIQISFDIDNENQIGSGFYSNVYKGKNENTNQDIAVKLIDKKKTDIKSYSNEVRNMFELAQPFVQNIMPLIGCVAFNQSYYIIAMPYAVNGPLSNWLANKDKKLSPDKQMETIKGISQGLYEMHKENILHRDIKPANILLDENMVPKLSDFGLSICVSENDSRRCGSLFFMAPDLLYYWGVLDQDRQQTFATDLHALALVAWCIVANMKQPYQKIITTKDNTERARELGYKLYKQQYREKIPTGTHKKLTYFIESLWAHDPNDIPNAKEALDILNSKKNELQQYRHSKFTQSKMNLLSVLKDNKSEAVQNNNLKHSKK